MIGGSETTTLFSQRNEGSLVGIVLLAETGTKPTCEVPLAGEAIVGLQKEVSDKLAFIGCWDLQAKWITPGVPPTEEELRARIRETIDKYGPGGNVAILCMIMNPQVDLAESMLIMHDEIVKYGTNYYC